jgi:hypothetical protein
LWWTLGVPGAALAVPGWPHRQAVAGHLQITSAHETNAVVEGRLIKRAHLLGWLLANLLAVRSAPAFRWRNVPVPRWRQVYRCTSRRW